MKTFVQYVQEWILDPQSPELKALEGAATMAERDYVRAWVDYVSGKVNINELILAHNKKDLAKAEAKVERLQLGINDSNTHPDTKARYEDLLQREKEFSVEPLRRRIQRGGVGIPGMGGFSGHGPDKDGYWRPRNEQEKQAAEQAAQKYVQQAREGQFSPQA